MRARGVVVDELTLVFTDIQGSTKLLQEQGSEVFAALLSRHRHVLAAVWTAHGGRIGWLEGDGSLVVFDSAAAALAACAEAQRSLASEQWPHGGELLVRMGAHTGPVQWMGDDLVGLTVHLAARVAGAAHGGQVVFTQDTAVAAGLDLSSGTVDLGEHRLKDIDALQRLWQLVIPGMERTFPALKTLSVRSNNLPVERTAFIGREDSVRAGLELLRAGRLLTLTGPGGVGKTRTACEIGAALVPDVDDGVWLARLDTALTMADVVAVVRQAVGAKDAPERSAIDALTEHLRDKRMLLILDNAEHVMDAVIDLTEAILTSCPSVKLLVTSQEVLRLLGERVLRLDPLCQPGGDFETDGDGAAGEDTAMRLFRESVLRADPGIEFGPAEMDAALRICRRLDGLPLALELAAARVPGLGLAGLADRLERVQALPPTRGGSPRHRSVQAALDWSHGLLSPVEQAVFRRLAVFTGGGDIGLAERACAGGVVAASEVSTVIASLIDKSLVVGLSGGRWRLLFLVADYAAERLDDSGERAEAEQALTWALIELCADTEASILTARRNALVGRTQAQERNLVAALQRGTNTGVVTEEMRPILLSLNRVWLISGDLRTVEGVVAGLTDTPIGATALAALAWQHLWSGSGDCVKEACASIRLARRQGDLRAEADGWRVLGYVSMERRRFVLADEALRRSRALAVESDKGLWLNGRAIHADVFLHRGHPACALALLEDTLAIAAPTDNGQILGQIHTRMAHVQEARGELDDAVSHARFALEFQRRSGYGGTSVADSLLLVNALARQGKVLDAVRAVDDAFAILESEPERVGLPVGFRGIVALLLSQAIRLGAGPVVLPAFSAILTVTASSRREDAIERLVTAALADVDESGLQIPVSPADTRVADVVRLTRHACAQLMA